MDRDIRAKRPFSGFEGVFGFWRKDKEILTILGRIR